MSDAKAKPGWFPHSSMPDTKRWWDGEKWTDHVAPAVSIDPELIKQLTMLNRHAKSLAASVGLFVVLSIIGGIIWGIAVASASDSSSQDIHQTCIDAGLDC